MQSRNSPFAEFQQPKINSSSQKINSVVSLEITGFGRLKRENRPKRRSIAARAAQKPGFCLRKTPVFALPRKIIRILEKIIRFACTPKTPATPGVPALALCRDLGAKFLRNAGRTHQKRAGLSFLYFRSPRQLHKKKRRKRCRHSAQRSFPL